MSRPDVATVAELFSGVYDIIEPMPWNGLAPTYKARKDGADVVVALLPIDAEGSPKAAKVFEARAKALVGLEHPRLMPVNAQAIRHGVPYLELPYVEGETLDWIVLRIPLHRDRAVTIARRVLRALELLEAVDILHLDLTPANILITGQDDVKVLGAGVAALLREVRDTEKTGPTGKGSGPDAGRFLPPELLIGDKLDARSDIFSVGALLHYMLTGYPMGKGGPPPPEDLSPIIAKATREVREARYSRAAGMRAALEATGAPLSVVPPPTSAAEPPAPPPSVPPATASVASVPVAPPPPPPPPVLSAGAAEGEPAPAMLAAPPEATEASAVMSPAAPARSRSRGLLFGALGVVAVGAIVTGIVLVSDAGGDADDASATASASAADTAESAASPATAGTEEPEPVESPARDTPDELDPSQDPDPELFRAPELELEAPVDMLADELPEPLDTIWPRVQAGEELPLRERHLVMRYGSANPTDARPHLLLARDFMARGWSSDAITEYTEAFATDPACKADATMLDDLLELSSRERSGPTAARTVARIYGKDALPYVAAMLEDYVDAGRRRRLEQLQSRLESL